MTMTPKSASTAPGSGARSALASAIAHNEQFLADASARAGVTDITKLSATAKAEIANGGGYQMIAVGKLQRSWTNRDVEKDDEFCRLVESIREHGILQPLLARAIKFEVRRCETGQYQIVTLIGDEVRFGGPHFAMETAAEAEAERWRKTKPTHELVIGEQRWTAAKEAGLKEVPVVVRHMTEREALIAQLTENLRRKGLRPIAQAEGYRRMRDMGMTIPEIAKELGEGGKLLSKTTIYARLALLDLPTEALAAAKSGKMPASHAELITRLDDEDARRELTRKILHPEKREEVENGILSFRRSQQLMEEAREELKDRREWKEKSEKLAGDNITVLGFDQSEKFLTWGAYVPAGYLDLASSCYADPKRRNYETLLRKSEIAITIARTDDGNPKKCVLEKDAAKAIKEAGYTFELTNVKKPANAEAEKKAARLKRERSAIRRQAWKLTLNQLVDAAERNGPTEYFLRYIAGVVNGKLCCSSVRAADVVKRRGLGETDRPGERLKVQVKSGFNAKQLCGFIVEGLAYEHQPYDFGDGDWPTGFVEICKLWGIDPKKIEAEVRTAGKKGK